jgi:hypothetical protein
MLLPNKEKSSELFACSRTAALARWHAEECKEYGLLRHPADSLLCKDFEDKNPKFSKDSRSIRLALATYGFNPFRSMNLSYSIWPILMIPYKFPPNMVIKQPNDNVQRRKFVANPRNSSTQQDESLVSFSCIFIAYLNFISSMFL